MLLHLLNSVYQLALFKLHVNAVIRLALFRNPQHQPGKFKCASTVWAFFCQECSQRGEKVKNSDKLPYDGIKSITVVAENCLESGQCCLLFLRESELVHQGGHQQSAVYKACSQTEIYLFKVLTVQHRFNQRSNVRSCLWAMDV